MKLCSHFYVRYLVGAVAILAILLAASNEITSTRFADLAASQIRDDILLAGALDNSNSLGQTFVSQKPYFSSIKLFLKDQAEQNPQGSYTIWIHLKDEEGHDIAFQEYSYPIADEDFSIDFSFSPQPDSLHTKYSILIETDAPANQLSIWTSLHDTYSDGDIFLNEISSNYDLTFRTYYRPPFSVWVQETLSQGGHRFIQLLLISVLFFFAGFLLYTLFGGISNNPVEAVIHSIGLGIVIPSILFLVMSLAGIKINRIHILIALVMLALASGVKYGFSHKTRTGKSYISATDHRETILLAVMFLLAAFTRTSQISDLLVPNWVDGIVHQQFITRILERQTIPMDAVYPKGFHASVVFEFLLFGRSLPESILLMGQWLSLMSGLAFYLLARKLLRIPYGLFATCVYWFWSAFPAYLIDWGRYPYLQSLVLLPILVSIVMDRSMERRLQHVYLAFFLPGIGLTYYGTFLIFLALLITILIHHVSNQGNFDTLNKMKWIGLAIIPISVILLIRFNRALDLGIRGQDSTVSLFEDSIQTFHISLTHGGWFLWMAGISGFVIALFLHLQQPLLMAEWFLILISMNLLQAASGITVSSIANSVIFLAIPLALLTGLAFRFFAIRIAGFPKPVSYTIILLVAFSGAYNISGIIQPQTNLYSFSDQRAMTWIAQNTSTGSVFLINSFSWGDDRAPSDAGGWIPHIAKRNSILFDPANLEKQIVDRDIDYIYVGRRYGDIDPHMLLDDDRLSLVYRADDILIFKLHPWEN